MTMTTHNMNPPVPENALADRPKTPAEIAAENAAKLNAAKVTQLTEAQVQAAAEAVKKQLNLASEDDPLTGVEDSFKDQVKQEEANANKTMYQLDKMQASVSGVSIKDLCEEDAYNLEIGIAAGAMYSPDFLKVKLKDSNYIARWCNKHPVRMAALVGQGFRMIVKEEVDNLDTLDMFLDSQQHFVYSDLVAMKIPKNIYYAGLRKAYIKSLHATNATKAAQAGASFASRDLTGALSGGERSYMTQHQEQGSKPIYNPNIGV